MQQKKFVEPVLKVIFLGGVGEIGKNMTALEFGEDIIIIDCGSTFPTTDTPGVDLIIPDPAYLLLNPRYRHNPRSRGPYRVDPVFSQRM